MADTATDPATAPDMATTPNITTATMPDMAITTATMPAITTATMATDADLELFLEHEAPRATSTKHRDATKRLYTLFVQWLKEYGAGSGPTQTPASTSSPSCHMFVAGSYRLGVHTEDADIDVVFVVPASVTRDAVFRSFLKRLQGSPGVTDIQAIPRARVPILAFFMDGQEFDMMTCHVPEVHLRGGGLPPREVLLGTYDWMNGADEASILSFNGPRVTEKLLELAAPRMEQFHLMVRTLRLWAKRRGLYSNKCGYFGGVNLTLLAAYVLVRHPACDALALVGRVFRVFAEWRWSKKTPVRVEEPESAADPEEAASSTDTRCPIWLRAYEWTPTKTEAMVLLSPCFPRANTMYSALKHTKATMCNELRRARDLWHLDAGPALVVRPWAMVCAPLTSLGTCPRFVALTIQVPDSCEGLTWQGFVESQIRYLVQFLSLRDIAVKEFRHVPVWVTTEVQNEVGARMRSRTTYITAEDDGVIRTFLIKVDLQDVLTQFARELWQGPPRPPHCKLTAAYIPGADVHPSVFGAEDPARARARLQEAEAMEAGWVQQYRTASRELAKTAMVTTTTTPHKAKANPSSSSNSKPTTPPDDDLGLPSCNEAFLATLPAHVQGLCRLTARLADTKAKGTGSADGGLVRARVRTSHPSTPVVSNRQAPHPPPLAPKPQKRLRIVGGVEAGSHQPPPPPFVYVPIVLGPGRCIVSGFDVYIGPPWDAGKYGPLRARHPCLELAAGGPSNTLAAYRAFLTAAIRKDATGTVARQVAALRGLRVACWCVDVTKCHASVLLECLS